MSIPTASPLPVSGDAPDVARDQKNRIADLCGNHYMRAHLLKSCVCGYVPAGAVEGTMYQGGSVE